MRNRTSLVLVSVLAVTGLVGLAVPAHAQKAESRVEITSAKADTEHVMIKGKVSSNAAKCKKRRTVTVYHDTPPAGPDANDYLIDTVQTDRKGRWSLTSVALPDKVYAVMDKKGSCSGDTSPTENVEFSPAG